MCLHQQSAQTKLARQCQLPVQNSIPAPPRPYAAISVQAHFSDNQRGTIVWVPEHLCWPGYVRANSGVHSMTMVLHTFQGGGTHRDASNWLPLLVVYLKSTTRARKLQGTIGEISQATMKPCHDSQLPLIPQEICCPEPINRYK